MDDRAPLLAPRTWGILGVVLVGGVVAWKLAGSTYRGDIETICSAEKGAGVTVEKDMAKVSAWVRAHLATPEGNQFFSSLSDARMAERAKRLQGEATTQHVGSCPMVASYELVAAEGDYRSDLQHLCSSVAFPKMAELDDSGRLARLEDWIANQAKSPRTKELAEPLRQAATPADRARLLREAAGKMSVYSCDGAKVIESPQAAPPTGAPTVRVVGDPQIIGPLKEDELERALGQATPGMSDCYKKVLEKSPNLAGKMAVKLEVDPDGNVARAAPAQVGLEVGEAARCVIDPLKAMKLPKNTGPLASTLVAFELTTGAPTPAPSPSAAASK
jgi:hypothetical protein